MVNSMLTDRITRFRQRRTAPLILELDLTEGIAEEPPSDPLTALTTMRRPRLADVLDGLRRARSDDRVMALVAKVGGRPIGLAQVQELHAAIREFAGSGKLTVAWAETFGDFSPGNVPYYLATAFDRIYLQPSGDLGLTGISVQNWFYRGALDKLGVEFQVGARGDPNSPSSPSPLTVSMRMEVLCWLFTPTRSRYLMNGSKVTFHSLWHCPHRLRSQAKRRLIAQTERGWYASGRRPLPSSHTRPIQAQLA